MEKLQFLDLSDLNAVEEEQLTNILFNEDYLEVVELPPENLPPSWEQHPIPYPDLSAVVEIPAQCCGTTWIPAAYPGEAEHVDMEELVEQQVDYTTGSPMMVPHTMQYTQMIPAPNVYVSNVTANVNVHGFVPQPIQYATPVPYMSTPDPRKTRPAKTPTKRSPEASGTIDQTNFPPQPFAQPYYPSGHPMYSPYWVMATHQLPRPFVSPVPPVYSSPAAGFSQPVFSPTQHMQPPPAEPREDNPVPYSELVDHSYEPQETEEEELVEEEQPYEEDPCEHQPDQEQIPEVVEKPVVEEVKVEKPLAIKTPPVNAFISTPAIVQKPPFPTGLSKHKPVDNGPEFFDPPVETGPPKKSYASLFGSAERASQMIQLESQASKPLAMIHPTVHSNVNNNVTALKPQNGRDKPEGVIKDFPPNKSFSNSAKERPEKMVLADYDINIIRLGEFLNTYELDHKPLMLTPRGLTNRSNYCYINAILQALVACPTFYNLMRAIPPSQENKGTKSRTPIVDSMVRFVNEFSPMSLSTRPVGRKEKAQATKDNASASSEVVAGPAFEPAYVYKVLGAMHAAFPVEGRQEDAEEFLTCLLNGLNDEMLEAMKLVEPPTNGLTNGDITTNGEGTTNGIHDVEQNHEWTEVVNKSNKSVVTRRTEFRRTPLSAIFRGQMRSRVIRSGIENHTTDNIQPFFTLQLDIEKTNSVEKALELLVGKDEVVGGSCPQSQSSQESVFTQTSLEELPLILMLHLKCFHYKLQTCSKIIKTVEFPIDLRIDSKLLSVKSKTTAKDRQYKLLAVVYHDGKEATKGHYITDVYHMGYNGWVRYDDATVRPVSLQQVLNPKSPRVPYLLYYRRCDTINR